MVDADAPSNGRATHVDTLNDMTELPAAAWMIPILSAEELVRLNGTSAGLPHDVWRISPASAMGLRDQLLGLVEKAEEAKAVQTSIDRQNLRPREQAADGGLTPNGNFAPIQDDCDTAPDDRSATLRRRRAPLNRVVLHVSDDTESADISLELSLWQAPAVAAALLDCYHACFEALSPAAR